MLSRGAHHLRLIDLDDAGIDQQGHAIARSKLQERSQSSLVDASRDTHRLAYLQRLDRRGLGAIEVARDLCGAKSLDKPRRYPRGNTLAERVGDANRVMNAFGLVDIRPLPVLDFSEQVS